MGKPGSDGLGPTRACAGAAEPVELGPVLPRPPAPSTSSGQRFTAGGTDSGTQDACRAPAGLDPDEAGVEGPDGPWPPWLASTQTPIGEKREVELLSCADAETGGDESAERDVEDSRWCADAVDGAGDLVSAGGDAVDMRMGEIRLAEPGEFLAGIPAILGFVPVRSLVVAVLRAAPHDPDSALIDVVARFDLAPTPAGTGARTLAATVAEVCAQQGVVGVLASVVDDRRCEPEPGVVGRDCLVTALAAQLEARSIPLCGAWAVQAIASGHGWWSVLGADRRGVVPDPAISPITLSHVLDGKQVRRSRSELIAVVAVDPVMRERVGAEMASALARAHQRFAEAAGDGDRLGYSRHAAQYLLWQIANVESGVRMTAAELAESAAALRDKHARDAMFALAGTDHAAAAEQLWAMMTRGLPDTDRAEAAALLGYCAYARGDGPLAGIALSAALDAEPEHPMAALLDAALRSGMDPQRLQRLITCGREAAIDLGIDLGARR